MDVYETDEALTGALVAGERAAFETAYRRHGAAVLAFLRKYTGDEDAAADLAQECFVRLWEGRARLVAGRSLFNWLVTVALNLWRDRGRRLVARPERSLAGLAEAGFEPADAAPGHAEVLHERDLVAAVRRAVAGLPEDERAAVVLKLVNGLTWPEVATALGCSERTAKRVGVRATERLERALARRGIGKEAMLVWTLA